MDVIKKVIYRAYHDLGNIACFYAKFKDTYKERVDEFTGEVLDLPSVDIERMLLILIKTQALFKMNLRHSNSYEDVSNDTVHMSSNKPSPTQSERFTENSK